VTARRDQPPTSRPAEPNRSQAHPNGVAGKETDSYGRFPSPRLERDVEMTRAARGNGGVIPASRLYRLGFTEREIRGLVAHGDLKRVHRGVYADGRAQLSDRGRLHAALLALGNGAWLPGNTGAAAWGLRTGVPALIEVTLVADHTPRHPGLRVRRAVHAPHPSEIKVRRGLRISSIPRMLIEIAADGASIDEVHDLVDAAVRKKLLDVEDLKATLDRNKRRRGAAKVTAACAAYLPQPGRKSLLEQSFDRWLAAHPEVPEPQRNIYLGPWEIDCYWPEHELALELDGREFHITAEDFERDRLKDAWLQRNGNQVLRITWRRWCDDRRGAEHDLTTMLALGQHRAALRPAA
jgi:hypothetical protein